MSVAPASTFNTAGVTPATASFVLCRICNDCNFAKVFTPAANRSKVKSPVLWFTLPLRPENVNIVISVKRAEDECAMIDTVLVSKVVVRLNQPRYRTVENVIVPIFDPMSEVIVIVADPPIVVCKTAKVPSFAPLAFAGFVTPVPAELDNQTRSVTVRASVGAGFESPKSPAGNLSEAASVGALFESASNNFRRNDALSVGVAFESAATMFSLNASVSPPPTTVVTFFMIGKIFAMLVPESPHLYGCPAIGEHLHFICFNRNWVRDTIIASDADTSCGRTAEWVKSCLAAVCTHPQQHYRTVHKAEGESRASTRLICQDLSRAVYVLVQGTNRGINDVHVVKGRCAAVRAELRVLNCIRGSDVASTAGNADLIDAAVEGKS